MPILEKKYHVQTIEIFGSYARGGQSKESDLDLLISFSQQYSLWNLLDVKEFLSNKIGITVDLVTKDSIKPLIREQIIQEAIPI
ncbi:MAG: nucleotidyltransferase family protein [Candidatus Bathyarchaeia archaeon]|jgi:predicted nucleotidyltransferase